MTNPEPVDESGEGPAGSAYEGGRSPFRPRADVPMVQQISPVTAEVTEYTGRRLSVDLVAGLTVAALTIPSAMAFAGLAGLPPVSGLYAVLLPTVVYTLLGSSKQLIVGPEGTVSALVAAAILPLAAAGSDEAVVLAGTLALLVGAVFVVAWLLRLGWIADYFSLPVLVGYLAGVGVVLIAGQLGKLLGLSIEASDSIPQLVEVMREAGDANGTTILVGVVALMVLVPLRFLAPKFPAALLVVATAIVASWIFDLQSHGVAILGDIPSGLPSLGLSFRHSFDLLPAALGIFVVSYADGVLTARSFAGRHGLNVRANQELLAFAGMSAAAGVSQGLPVGASGSRTAVNDQMGATSQFSGLIAAGAVLVVVLFLTGPIEYLPTAVLGAIIISAAIGLIDPASFRDLLATSRFEFGLALVGAVGVVTVGVLRALLVAVLLSIVDVIRRSARPHDAVLGWVDSIGRWANVSLHPRARLTEGIVVYRLDDRLFFANAEYVKGRVHEAIRGAPYEVRWLVFDAEAVSNVDVTAAEALEDLGEELGRAGIGIALARARPYVRDVLDDAGVTAVIDGERFFPTVRSAVAWCDDQRRTQPGTTVG